MDLHLSQIGQIAINVHQLDRAVAFYRDTLGMKFLFQAPPGLAFFDCGGVRLMLAKPERPELDHPASPLYYRVNGIQAAADALKKQGIAFEEGPKLIAKMPDHDLWMAFFRDTEGNPVVLMDEVRRSP
jgi:methylmalonyl-CoA/ethylmalonyl-CoA epimerase